MADIEPVPYYSPALEGRPERMSVPLFRWLDVLRGQVSVSARALETTTLTTQSASIAATPVLVTSSAGLYRVTIYARITRAATTSSSLTVTIGWTESGVSLTKSFPAVTGNLTTTSDQQTITILADAASAITYATTYASVGATSMQYRLTVIVEQL